MFLHLPSGNALEAFGVLKSQITICLVDWIRTSAGKKKKNEEKREERKKGKEKGEGEGEGESLIYFSNVDGF